MTKTKTPQLSTHTATKAMLRRCRVASQKEAAAKNAARKRKAREAIKRTLEADDRRERQRTLERLRRRAAPLTASEREGLDAYLGEAGGVVRRQEALTAADLQRRYIETQGRGESQQQIQRRQEAAAVLSRDVRNVPSAEQLQAQWLAKNKNAKS